MHPIDMILFSKELNSIEYLHLCWKCQKEQNPLLSWDQFFHGLNIPSDIKQAVMDMESKQLTVVGTTQPNYIKRYKVEFNNISYYTYATTMEQVALMDDIYGADKGEWLNQPNVEPPLVKVPTAREFESNAFAVHRQVNPDDTVEDFLNKCVQPSVALDPNDSNPLGRHYDYLAELRQVVMTKLDNWKRGVDASYNYYHGQSERRAALLEKQWKHIRRYAKSLIKNVVNLEGDHCLVHIDIVERDKFGFVTSDVNGTTHTRHFTIKFVDFNWIIVED